MTEQWKPVVGYEGLYEVSDLGRIKSVAREAINNRGYERGRPIPERILRQSTANNGYKLVRLYRDGKGSTLTVHSLVLKAHVGPRPEGHQGCHSPNGKEDNRLCNLRWDTASSNQLDKIVSGTMVCGERVNTAKLNPDTVRDIRRSYTGRRGEASRIARRVGTTPQSIRNIIARKTWAHIA